MSKKALKTTIIEKQKNIDPLTGKFLDPNLSLVDTDRILPKAEGGVYTDKNTRIVNPVAHMKRHDNYRLREKQLNEIKTTMDGREQVRKLTNSANNRILAWKRGTDDLDEETLAFLEEQGESTKKRLSKIDRKVKKMIEKCDIPIAHSALDVDGVGAITVAYMLIYIDIEKANYCSSLWSYCGLHKASHNRYTKGESGGGNKTLRTVLYSMASSQIRTRGAYRDVYDREKAKLEVSEKMTKSRNTQGKLIECMWKDTKKCHRHGAAIRQIMKHFLADWWHAHRELEGLETPDSYAVEKLGHKTWIDPKERGWKY